MKRRCLAKKRHGSSDGVLVESAVVARSEDNEPVEWHGPFISRSLSSLIGPLIDELSPILTDLRDDGCPGFGSTSRVSTSSVTERWARNARISIRCGSPRRRWMRRFECFIAGFSGAEVCKTSKVFSRLDWPQSNHSWPPSSSAHLAYRRSL